MYKPEKHFSEPILFKLLVEHKLASDIL